MPLPITFQRQTRGMTRVISLVASLLLISSFSAKALPTLTVEDLTQICGLQATGESLDSCDLYVQAFIDGAIATDPRVAMRVTLELERQESFTDRAFRTRLGQRMDRLGPSFLAGFCVGEPVPVQQLSELIREELQSAAGGARVNDSARELVYNVLAREFPCETEDD